MYFFIFNNIFPLASLFLSGMLLLSTSKVVQKKVKLHFIFLIVLVVNFTFYQVWSAQYRTLNEKIDNLKISLAAKEVSLEEQKELARSPITKVRLLLASDPETSKEILNVLKNDSSSKVRVETAMSLQKKGVSPLWENDQYKLIENVWVRYEIPLIVALGVFTLLFVLRKTENFLILSIFLPALVFSLTIDEYRSSKRVPVVVYKYKNKTLTEKEVDQVLRSITKPEMFRFAESAEFLPDRMLLSINKERFFPQIQKEMSKRNIMVNAKTHEEGIL